MNVFYNSINGKYTVSDLGLVTMGYEDCEPSHSFGPAIREYNLVHFVVSGKGIFRNQAGTFTLREGDLFLILPSELTYYKADDTDPWSYYWVGFDGFKAKELVSDTRFTHDNPVVRSHAPDHLTGLFRQMIGIADAFGCSGSGCLGMLYLIFHHLIAGSGVRREDSSPQSFSRESFTKAVMFMEQNYPYKISIDGLSKSIGLDRTGLFRAFVREAGISPKEYLIRYRLGKACELMRKTSLPVSVIAESVGIPDVSHFSDIFKSRTGLSPRSYRRIPEDELRRQNLMKGLTQKRADGIME